MFAPSTDPDSVNSHLADMIIAAFFFTMRACEFTVTPTPGWTKRTQLRDVTFRDRFRRTVPHNVPSSHSDIEFATTTFGDQKSGKKMDARTQRCTVHAILCPVRRFRSLALRLFKWFPKATPATDACTVRLSSGEASTLPISLVEDSLRHTCEAFGGRQVFGMHPHELGSRSIRSGAAVALFLMDHSPAKIVTLGRWSSDAFLDCIRPQALEWTTDMSSDMASLHHFTDLSSVDRAGPAGPRTRAAPRLFSGLSPAPVTVPRFYLHH